MNPGVVVIGASFGGFDALKMLLGSLPATFPSPLAIVQHQGSPGTGLAGLLQRYTALVVADAEDKDELRPGVAYLAPPGYHLLVEPGSLALSVDPPVSHARPSIDALFESAADVYGTRVIGVILTGTGRDGATGLARIKQRGGRTIVQDPASATRAAMPAAALAGSVVDWVLPLEKIGPRLVELLQPTRSGAAPQLVAHESPVTRS